MHTMHKDIDKRQYIAVSILTKLYYVKQGYINKINVEKYVVLKHEDVFMTLLYGFASAQLLANWCRI